MGSTNLGTILQNGSPVISTFPQMMNARWYYVDPENGANGNSGDADNPLATIAAAYDKCVSGRGDVVALRGGPTSGGTTGHSARLSETLTWSKHNTHLIGLGAPTKVGQRARITGESTGATFTPLIKVTGSGCIFANFAIFHDYGVDPVCIEVEGDRNYFENVNIQGMGVAAGGDDAAACSLLLDGAEECTFRGCVIGLDTIERSTTNAEIEFVGGSKRIIFEDCEIISFADNAGHLFVKIDGSADIDRYIIFRNCTFINAVESTATTMTQAMDVHNSCGGMVLLHNCVMVGATDWAAADNGNVFISNAAATAGTSGLAVAVTR